MTNFSVEKKVKIGLLSNSKSEKLKVEVANNHLH